MSKLKFDEKKNEKIIIKAENWNCINYECYLINKIFERNNLDPISFSLEKITKISNQYGKVIYEISLGIVIFKCDSWYTFLFGSKIFFQKKYEY